MTKRKTIVDALVEELKEIDGTASYASNLYNNVHPKLKFWNEVQDFPYVCVVAGPESRQYLPSNFVWGFINVAIKAYTKGEDDAQSLLEDVLADIESKINSFKGRMTFNSETTAEIRVESVITDEGLLAPYGVGEILVNIRYQIDT